jgi:antitoxin component of MazEF toxin-antitoxin module
MFQAGLRFPFNIGQVPIGCGLRRFWFRSPESNRDTDERGWGASRRMCIPRSWNQKLNLQDSDPVARMRRSIMSRSCRARSASPACRAKLGNLEHTLVAGDQSLAQLQDHFTVLRKLEPRLGRLIDQPRGSALRRLTPLQFFREVISVRLFARKRRRLEVARDVGRPSGPANH